MCQAVSRKAAHDDILDIERKVVVAEPHDPAALVLVAEPHNPAAPVVVAEPHDPATPVVVAEPHDPAVHVVEAAHLQARAIPDIDGDGADRGNGDDDPHALASQAHARTVRRGQGFEWHGVVFTRSTAAGTKEQYQVRCPWPGHSDKGFCTRTAVFQDSSEEMVIWRLKTWSVRSCAVGSKQEHMALRFLDTALPADGLATPLHRRRHHQRHRCHRHRTQSRPRSQRGQRSQRVQRNRRRQSARNPENQQRWCR